MRWRPGMMTAVAVLGTAFLTGAGAATAASAATAADAVTGAGAAATAVAAAQSGTWGTAAEIPGSNLLNHGGQATINAVSCAASGNCAAGGSYTSGFSSTAPIVQAFVADKTKNIWRRAEEVPGTASLNTGGNAKINTVSCAAQGDCSAGGYYTDSSRHQQALVVTQTNGTWGNAEEVPGSAALNTGAPGAVIVSVSCTAPGDCSAGGYYTDSSGHQQALVVTQTNGTWGNAEEVPGSGGLNAGGYARVLSVSCGAAGGCSAGGVYSTSSVDGIPTVQAMVVSETNGTWGTAEEVPGTAALNGGGYAAINSVSCPSAGNCSAGGSYTSTTPATQAFTVAETNGTWGNAQPVPGIAALNNGGLAQLNSVSCSSVGNCSAGGFYLDSSFNSQAFVVGESGGTWGSAEEVPGTAALDQQSPGAATGSVSCSAPGDCSAGGSYTDASGAQQAFVVNQAGGTWGSAEEVPGTAPLNGGGQASIQSVSCAPGGLCSAVGQYENVKLNTQVFAVSQS
jgi:hypothetical protein